MLDFLPRGDASPHGLVIFGVGQIARVRRIHQLLHARDLAFQLFDPVLQSGDPRRSRFVDRVISGIDGDVMHLGPLCAVQAGWRTRCQGQNRNTCEHGSHHRRSPAQPYRAMLRTVELEAIQLSCTGNVWGTGMRLNVWQRAGVVASVLWIIVGALWYRAYIVGQAVDESMAIYQICRTAQDTGACLQRSGDVRRSVLDGWEVIAMVVATAPVILGWMLAYIVIWTVRWVLAGRSVAPGTK